MPIKTVASFKRMREFSALGLPWIAAALKSSTALEVDETNEKVRRRTEVTEPKGQFERSVYAVSVSVILQGFADVGVVAERVWRGDTRITTKARGFLQSVRAYCRCSHAACR